MENTDPRCAKSLNRYNNVLSRQTERNNDTSQVVYLRNVEEKRGSREPLPINLTKDKKAKPIILIFMIFVRFKPTECGD